MRLVVPGLTSRVVILLVSILYVEQAYVFVYIQYIYSINIFMHSIITVYTSDNASAMNKISKARSLKRQKNLNLGLNNPSEK